jgi:heme A synthase
MTASGKDKFPHFAIFALCLNVVVILWGVFLRASKSGDGCGQFWLTCNGEVIPSAPQFKTIIEFTHRVSTALDGLVMLILLLWAIFRWRRLRNSAAFWTMLASIGSFIFILTEAAVGAGLVLTGNTAENLTSTRPLWAMGHLVNTFILLSFLTATVWASRRDTVSLTLPASRELLFICLAAILLMLISMSGSLAALSNMLFPSESLAEGIAKDFDQSSHLLVRFRLSHPLLSILGSVVLIFISGKLTAAASDSASKSSRYFSILLIVQVIFGAATLLSLGPIVMQVGHLLLADLIWIFFNLLVLHLFTESPATERIDSGKVSLAAQS